MVHFLLAMRDPGTITQYLFRLREGDASVYDSLVALLYDELRELARHRMQGERSDHTLSATALVHEVYLRFIRQKLLDLSNREEFLAVSSKAMRNILVDHARARSRVKRGGNLQPVPFEACEHLLSDKEVTEVVALDDALSRLAKMNERASQVVQYRFFGGLTIDETALIMGISKRSVQRSWTTAKAWLRKEITLNNLV